MNHPPPFHKQWRNERISELRDPLWHPLEHAWQIYNMHGPTVWYGDSLDDLDTGLKELLRMLATPNSDECTFLYARIGGNVVEIVPFKPMHRCPTCGYETDDPYFDFAHVDTSACPLHVTQHHA